MRLLLWDHGAEPLLELHIPGKVDKPDIHRVRIIGLTPRYRLPADMLPTGIRLYVVLDKEIMPQDYIAESPQ
ncbi:hypothetical protein A2Z33_01900 [Candidatus Gottesmanbacteria bacterium RBG_16_52_11]|uniref:Uncharacterized protein n=1 Tax=Candidatus Gottesmanbacteria bacterium RBG_16_52_11 TaxID=1798374 RepID=A0A1F5YQR6_9BACT|nr:MAG: hypothetical protein A2Z33_01900 [Candidatus Gottesmanbacteria bacterium RBG_16_52_11]